MNTPPDVPTYKTCPQCGQTAMLNAPACQRCGYEYRTQFDPSQQMLQPTDPQYSSTQAPPTQDPPAQTMPAQVFIPSPFQPPAHPLPGAYYGNLPPGYIQVQPGSHSVVIAVLAAVLLLGAGQWYNYQASKGVLFLVGGVLFGLFSVILALFTFGLGLLLIPLMWIYNIVDTVLIANKINSGAPVGPWDWR